MVNVLHREDRVSVKFESEAEAYEFLEQLRWGSEGPTECPHCGSDKGAWFLKPKDPAGRKSKGGSSARSHRRVWKCRENRCRRQFSVLTNTVLHATKIPVQAWVGTVFDLCSDPDGVSARDIADRWGVTEKSAWAMLTRIEDALSRPDVVAGLLTPNAPSWIECQPEEAPGAQPAQPPEPEAVEVASVEVVSEGDLGLDVASVEVVSEGDLGAQTDRVERTSGAATDGNRPAPTASEQRVESDNPRAAIEDAPPSVGPAIEAPAGPKSSSSAPKPSVSAGRSSEHVDPAEQVKIDVERALAEAFGKPIITTGNAIDAGVEDAADKSLRSTPARPKSPASKPVEKSTKKTTKPQGSAPGPNAAKQARVEAGRGRVLPAPQASTSGDSLGIGWLDQALESDADTAGSVSPDQDQMLGGETARLGPSWASSDDEISAAESVEKARSYDQLDIFTTEEEANG